MLEHHEQDWADTDSLLFRRVSRKWSNETLLEQRGWFPLPDVMKRFDSGGRKYRKILAERDKMIKMGRDPVKVMGLKQYGNRIWAEMSTFSVWFTQSEALWLHRIPKTWDLQTFLKQKTGVFSLNRVLKLLPSDWPIKYPAMTHMIMQQEDSREAMGADKIDGVGFVVFMPKFGEWVRDKMN